MKLLGFIAIIAAIAFYVAWPAYSGYDINQALEAKDAARLAAKVDFPSVRASLRPAVAAKVENELAVALKKAGPSGGMLTDDVKAHLMPRVIDGVLNALVTPEMLIRIHEQGGSVKEAIDGLVAERAKSGDVLGDLIGGLKTGDGSADGGGLGKLGKLAEKYGIDPGKVLGGRLPRERLRPRLRRRSRPRSSRPSTTAWTTSNASASTDRLAWLSAWLGIRPRKRRMSPRKCRSSAATGS